MRRLDQKGKERVPEHALLRNKQVSVESKVFWQDRDDTGE